MKYLEGTDGGGMNTSHLSGQAANDTSGGHNLEFACRFAQAEKSDEIRDGMRGWQGYRTMKEGMLSSNSSEGH